MIPVYNVADFLPECLASLLGQTHRELEVVIVDDGSTDASGSIADDYAARDPRLHVVHTENRGLGAARNEGVRHASGRYLVFLDSDDVLPPKAYPVMVRQLEAAGSDFVSGSFVRWENGGLHEPPWMRRLHSRRRVGIRADDHPEILGDVMAWDKMFRRSFWDSAGLSWPEGILYEDQPTTTKAFLRGRFDVIPETRLPLADPHRRLLAHPATVLGAGSRRPDRDQADDACDGAVGGFAAGPGDVRGPRAGRRHVALLHRDPGCSRRLVVAPARRASWSSGDLGRWSTAASRRCTG